MNTRTTSPSTPAHPREDFFAFINQLNVRYNLGVSIPESTLTFSERKADQSPAARLYTRLEIHFYTGGLQALTSLLRQFDEKAKESWFKWVHKPGADADTLPTTTCPPLAANLAERDWLQTVFNKVLDKAQPHTQPSRSFSRAQSGPAAFGGDASLGTRSRHTTSTISQATSSRSHPKRRADADMRDVTKKLRADPDPLREMTASSSLQRDYAVNTSASAVGNMRPPRIRPSETASFGSNKLSRSCVSANTSLSDASAIFSDGGDAPRGTQDTIVASSEEQRRPALSYGLASCSQDSYDLTPSMEEGMRESFDNSRTLNGKTALTSSNMMCSSQSSEFTSLPSDVEIEVLHRTSDREALLKAKDHGLSSVWPPIPAWLQRAPFPIAWEVIRIGQSCGVDLTAIEMTPTSEWNRQKVLWESLQRHPAFQEKPFPAASSDAAWAAGLRAAGHDQSSVLSSDQQVVYTASLNFKRRSTSLQLVLQPLKVEQSYRLARYYGADRFVEVLIPSPDSSNLPASLKNDSSFFNEIIRWLGQDHAFCGRLWRAFYTKSGGSRKPVKDLQFGPEPRPVFRDRVYFFAERADSGPDMRRVRLSSMLNWALNLRHRDNGSQPVLKLFQRISLVLSRTCPTVVFAQHQVKHHEEDLLSPTGKVMNDGVARMSPAVARKIRACLSLKTTPSAVQARLGSAKGMWVVDSTGSPSSDEIWIETFPSQRKWVMDWSTADEHHRTLEIRGCASMPKSASFNLQFLPVIEDRATDRASMRQEIGSLLKTNLRIELDGQKRALQTPLQFRHWTHENATHKHDRIVHGHVPYLGGMPQEDEEVMNMMLDAGFDSSNKRLNEITWNIQKRKCETLEKKLNIKVGRSVYLYMVVDFLGVLEENEVHVGFSTAFEADEEWSRTMIHGTDVLVARSPAHFISDIQKVKAVFRPELADLTDVIVFPSKGDIPLADKLSGGDYDGDLAWVCWDHRIVDNFTSATIQEQPDLSQYMMKDTERFRDLLKKHDKSFSGAVRAMMNLAFEFNLSKCMLGTCTNYKERLCYARNSVCDEPARVLSTLLSILVDQPKQGLRFSPPDFKRLLKDFGLPAHMDDPNYKLDHWPEKKPKVQIIDYLKFDVAKPTIAEELTGFHKALEAANSSHWDEDLAVPYNELRKRAEQQSRSNSAATLLANLKADIETVHAEWNSCNFQGSDPVSFTERVTHVYKSWQGIRPREDTLDGSASSWTAATPPPFGGEMSEWALLKASTAFWMSCNSTIRSPRFVWQMACAQLSWIKALAVTTRNSHGVVGAPRAVIPSIYASLRPDSKFVQQITARIEGGSGFGLGNDGDADDDMNADG